MSMGYFLNQQAGGNFFSEKEFTKEFQFRI